MNHLLENREGIEYFDLERRDLVKVRGLSPLYWKTERVFDDGGRVKLQRVSGVGPLLYVKLMHSQRTDRFFSKFYDATTAEEIDPCSLIGRDLYVRATIKIESIFIGLSKITLQVKLHEAVVELTGGGLQRQ